MLRELIIFFPLGILSNSLLPIPFEPVLITFIAQHPAESAWWFAVVGCLCATIGEASGIRILRALRSRKASRPVPGWLAAGRKRFYVWASLVAFSPLPITVVRAAAFWRQPRPWLFGLSVGLGRLPRYLLIVGAWKGLLASGWLTRFI